MFKTTVLSFLLVSASMASTINFGTGMPGTIEGNNTTGTNVLTQYDPAWSWPLTLTHWVSTEINSNDVPNGTQTDYWIKLNLDGPVVGFVWVMADDSVVVKANGTTVGSMSGFTVPTFFDISPYLFSGMNTLDFVVTQSYFGPTALDVAGTVVTSQTPEPGTIMLMGVGLVGLGFKRRKV